MFLLAEDNAHDAYFVEHEFANASKHLQLRKVRDGAEAVEYLEGKGPYADRHQFPVPDVILLDLKMPRLDGYDFLKWLRNDAPGDMRLIPVIVMSSSNNQSDVTRSYGLGANSYVVKPVGWHAFQKCIKELGIYWSEHSETPNVPDQAG
jgi:CheY-like chemotaxis protein